MAGAMPSGGIGPGGMGERSAPMIRYGPGPWALYDEEVLGQVTCMSSRAWSFFCLPEKLTLGPVDKTLPFWIFLLSQKHRTVELLTPRRNDASRG